MGQRLFVACLFAPCLKASLRCCIGDLAREPSANLTNLTASSSEDFVIVVDPEPRSPIPRQSYTDMRVAQFGVTHRAAAGVGIAQDHASQILGPASVHRAR
jgi:hypothetical protein